MHGSSLLSDIGIAVMGAVVLAFPAYLVGVPPLLAYLLAGVLLGPHLGIGAIRDAESISTLSGIGLVLLMFILGLEIDVRKLMRAGKAVLLNGIIQFLGCVLLGYLFFRALGFGGGSQFELLYLAVACSLSSTLVVVKILSDRMQLGTLASRITLGVLVIQDLWAIAFLAMQPNLASLQASLLVVSLAKAGLLVGGAWVMARFVLPWILSRAGKQPELMLITAMAWCFGMAGAANLLHLSMEMGALIAGVSIASFPYHVEIAAKISSLRDFFIMLFFVALGLQIPVPTSEVVGLVAAMVVFLSISRILTVAPVLYSLRYGIRGSLMPALNLSQISEFSLVLAALGVSYGHLEPRVLAAFVLALAVTVLTSSIVIPHSHEIAGRIGALLQRLGIKDRVAFSTDTAEDQGQGEDRPQVVLLGFYREGSSLLQQILNRRTLEVAKKDLLVVDFNPEAHQKLRQMGIKCKYADIGSIDTLRHLGLENAKILACTIPDHILRGTNNLNMLRALKRIAPQAQIIVTAETIESAREMYNEGAAYVFVPRIISTHYLADVLETLESGRLEHIKTNGKAFVDRWSEVLP